MTGRNPDPYTTAGHIRRALHDITDHYEAAGNPPKISDDSDPRGGDQARPPTDVHAIDVRHQAEQRLAFWTRFILDAVDDGRITTRVDGHSIEGMATFINRWALALTEQHPGDASGHKEACREELAHSARQLKAVAHGTRTRSIEVGPCPEIVMTIDTEADLETFARCSGTVVAHLTERDPDNDDDGLLPQTLTCTIDRTHSWQPWQWADIGKRIERMAG